MTHFKLILPIALTCWAALALVLRPYLVYRRTGVNPVVLTLDDSTYGYVGKLFQVLNVLALGDVLAFELSERVYSWLTPIPWLEHPALRLGGFGLLLVSMVLIAVAQAQMGSSFRIGIDRARETDLVERGLYRYSRNPIYLGLILGLTALLLFLPNAMTVLLVGVAQVLVQIQARLEEEHMRRLHGERFEAFRRRVPRWF